MRLIDADTLIEAFLNHSCTEFEIKNKCRADENVIALIDNAPTVEERPQGEREFIEILAHYVPDDLCTYPEYRGKPYYSIHYKENGEEFVGFGTYKPEVLSRYLREYFMNCVADMRGGGK